MMRAHTMLLVAALAVSGCSSSGYRYGVSLDISDAPPPPRMVFYDRPGYLATYGGGVYVVDPGDNDFDMFRYGSYWYIYTGDYWYRSRAYGGPYTVIRFSSVPSRVLRVPERHWRRYPEHHFRDRDRDRYYRDRRDRDRDRDWDRDDS